MRVTVEKDFFTPQELATTFGVTQKCLGDWRRQPGHPLSFIKLGTGQSSRIRYPREAVERFIAERTNPTSKPQPEARRNGPRKK